MQTASDDEKLSVYIWYKDINYDLVENQVKQDTGLTIESIDTPLAMPDEELLNHIVTLSDESIEDNITAEEIKNQFEQYIEKTREQRLVEQQMTDVYIENRRAVARQKYIEKSNVIKEQLSIKTSDILFQSQYAPTLALQMTKNEIEKAAHNISVQEIGYYYEPEIVECSEQSMQKATRLDKVYETLAALDGTGVKVGVSESVPDPDLYDYVNVGNLQPLEDPSHVHNTMNVLLSVAPNCSVYATGTSNENIEQMISMGVSVINFSWGCREYGSYSYIDKWFDHLVAQHGVILVASNGNHANDEWRYTIAPAAAYNVIAVGYFDDKGTASFSDDELAANSCYVNGFNCAKPDVIAPWTAGALGSSSSSPAVTGIVALLLQLKPSLAATPQVIKAILQASCHRKVISNPVEVMTDGLTEKQGAGAVDAYCAISIIGRQQYKVGTDVFQPSHEFGFVVPNYGTNYLNISLSWLQENYYSDTNANHTDQPSVTVGNINNLDLIVRDRNGNIIKSSQLSNSSSELVYFSTEEPFGDYNIGIGNSSNLTEPVRYAIAWSRDNESYRAMPDETEEGIYYITSCNNKQYVSNSDGIVVQNIYTGGAEQRWFLSKNASGTYTLQSESLLNSGMLALGTQKNSYAYNVSVSQTGDNALQLTRNSDGSYRIQCKSSTGTQWYSLDVTGGSNESNMPLQWYTINNSTTTNQRWILKKVYYKHGDINMDGFINNKDLARLRSYLADDYGYTAGQVYLADVNLDGFINNKDVSRLTQALNDPDGYPL